MMDVDCELDLKTICRCCKRTESGMTSIFNGNDHPLFPAVEEMLNCIASLNVQENDGLPSLVCPSCLNKIQDAFTFILHLVRIDADLQHIVRQISTKTVKQKNGATAVQKRAALLANFHDSEDMYLSLTVEDLDTDDTIIIDDDDNCEHFDLVVEPNEIKEDLTEQLQSQQEQNNTTNGVPGGPQSDPKASKFACDMCYKTFKKSKSLTNHKNSKCCIKNDASHPDVATTKKFVKPPKLRASRKKTTLRLALKTDEFAVTEEEVEEVRPKSRTCRRSTTLKRLSATNYIFKCKLCVYSSERLLNLKNHLHRKHCAKQFACAKCARKFKLKSNMLRHWRKCNGEISKALVRDASKLVKSQQDLKDPLKMKQYYTVIDIATN